MVSFTPNELRRTLHDLRWPLRLTWGGMLAEQATRALWPLLSICLLGLAALMLGLHELVQLEVFWAGAVILGFGAFGALVFAFRRFRLPGRADALARLDASMPGRPISALLDDQVIGRSDDASAAVWRAHKARMAARASEARAIPGDLRMASRDPYALRYAALLAFLVALLFGSIWRVGSVSDMTPRAGDLVGGPIWEGWAEPPRYTGLPTLYLNDQPQGMLDLPKGTLISVRLYGELGALTLAETVSGRTKDIPASSDPVQDFTIFNDGKIVIAGPGGRRWDISVQPDGSPEVDQIGPPQVSALGVMELPFVARDDYGVEAGEARIMLDLVAVDRRHGLSVEPDQRPEIVVPLPMPITGDRRVFEENLIENFSEHPWSNLPVRVTLSVLDAAEQQAQNAPQQMTLPGRRFFDPVAAAVIEMRRDLLWSKTNASRVGPILRAVSYRPTDVMRSQTVALRLKMLIRRIEINTSYGLSDEAQNQIASDLWDLAIELEEGDLADALERMRRAQDRLNEAMKNGATDAEIAELMQELRRATDDYMQQLRRQQADEKGGNAPGTEGDRMQMTQNDLQQMMDRIQDLMEQGRMDEAERALKELQELLENMRITEGQPGDGSPSPGQQAMDGLSDTLRQQQGLSDQAFRDLQEQFGSGAQPGQSDGQNGEQGRGQGGQGQDGEGQGGEGTEGGNQGGGTGPGESELAERQRALRDELQRQQQNLPGQGTSGGSAAREALDEAGRAMDGAEQSLRNSDLPGAIDNQAQAMEALREGIRNLGEALAQQDQQGQPGQGTQGSDQRAQNNQDPLGRDPGANGAIGADGELPDGADPRTRARELLDEIRRRSGQTERPEAERDYLNRLLDRF